METTTITKITTTKKGRFALFCHEEFLFSVDEDTLLQYDIYKGAILSSQDMQAIQKYSETNKAKNQALRYLARRDYAEKELYNKLCLKYDEHTCASVMAYVHKLNLINDEQFAINRAQSLHARQKSRRDIWHTLQNLGVEAFIIEQALENLPNDEVEKACIILRKSYINKLKNGEKQKVMAALARRGFAYTDIRNAIEQIESEFEE